MIRISINKNKRYLALNEGKHDRDGNETLVATLLYLMTKFAETGDKAILRLIIGHIDMLEKHPRTEGVNLKAACERLKKRWKEKLLLNGEDNRKQVIARTVTNYIH